MICYHHSAQPASAICVVCGIGLCPDCIQRSASGKVVCSETCQQILQQTEANLNAVYHKTSAGHRLTGLFCGGAGLALLVFAVFAGFNQQWEWVALQLPLSLGLFVTGFFYFRLAHRSVSPC